jgi:hypothetical protein
MKLSNLKVPGVAWSALLIALAGVIQANFDNAVWYQVAMLVLAGVLKGMDLNFQDVVEKITVQAPLPVQTSRAVPGEGDTGGSVTGNPDTGWVFETTNGDPILEAELEVEVEPYWRRLLIG